LRKFKKANAACQAFAELLDEKCLRAGKHEVSFCNSNLSIEKRLHPIQALSRGFFPAAFDPAAPNGAACVPSSIYLRNSDENYKFDFWDRKVFCGGPSHQLVSMISV